MGVGMEFKIRMGLPFFTTNLRVLLEKRYPLCHVPWSQGVLRHPASHPCCEGERPDGRAIWSTPSPARLDREHGRDRRTFLSMKEWLCPDGLPGPTMADSMYKETNA
jgi:hypothetical protein